jgi:hypothetical protein
LLRLLVEEAVMKMSSAGRYVMELKR